MQDTRMRHVLPQVLLILVISTVCITVQADEPETTTLEQQRLALMRQRIAAMTVTAADAQVPAHLQPDPLFRYDDPTRGYIDGTVWKLGRTGRPWAIITAELHPRYGGSPRIVYDFLSLTDAPFSVQTSDVGGWRPAASAVAFAPIADAPLPAATPVQRQAQMRQLAARFQGTQDVENQKVQLRLLPTPIDRYQPVSGQDRSDGVIMVLCNGRNPALILCIETDGQTWSYGIGRLSLPSVLTVTLADKVVYHQQANTSSAGYTASNAAAVIPGYEQNQGSVEAR
jgi:hypothetical protein